MEKLPVVFKRKWLKALRSGKFKQATGRLGNKETGYCCLGVACSLAGATDKQMAYKGMPNILTSNAKQEVIRGGLPELLLGNNTESLDICDRLARFNDGFTNTRGTVSGKKTFKGIATWIEKHL